VPRIRFHDSGCRPVRATYEFRDPVAKHACKNPKHACKNPGLAASARSAKPKPLGSVSALSFLLRAETRTRNDFQSDVSGFLLRIAPANAVACANLLVGVLSTPELRRRRLKLNRIKVFSLEVKRVETKVKSGKLRWRFL
jgi:hypothetical protein